MKTLLLFLSLAMFAFAQDKPAPVKEDPKGLTDAEKLTLMESQRDAILSDNNLKSSMVAYYEAQTKAKNAADKWKADFEAASKKAGCALDDKFACQKPPASK
jgi:predicted lipoprotein